MPFYGVSVRADTAAITVGVSTNLQVNVVLHADPVYPCTLGDQQFTEANATRYVELAQAHRQLPDPTPN